jgi:hypothetical protein
MNNNNNNEQINNEQINMKTTFNFINDTYDKLSYFDLYGNSVIIFIFMTLFVFLVYSYCKIMQTKESIADDWVNQRCKPQNIPFAGFITHPDDKTSFEYTNENFQYCVQDILKNVASHALEPFQFMMKAINEVFSSIANAIQQVREVTNKIRNGLKDFATDVLSRILNVMVPMQKMFIALMDTFQKIQGVMTSGLYTMLGSYYTLQALMGAILELIVKILLILVVIIVGLWILPFTWPVAASMSVVFLSLAVPMAIIVYFMTEVMHIKSTAIPSLRCFDKKTKIMLNGRINRNIEDIKLGDCLIDGSIVTAKIKVLSKGLDMYNLNGIIVSESHVVKYNDKWIPIREHPNAEIIYNYSEPYLYCLNTSTKTIIINDNIFTDWDEVYDDTLEFVLKFKHINNPENISNIVDCGFIGNTKIKINNGGQIVEKMIGEIIIGDTLSTGGIVYGIVELNNNNLGNEIIYNLLVSNGIFEIDNIIYSDYNKNIDSILELKKLLSK